MHHQQRTPFGQTSFDASLGVSVERNPNLVEGGPRLADSAQCWPTPLLEEHSPAVRERCPFVRLRPSCVVEPGPSLVEPGSVSA